MEQEGSEDNSPQFLRTINPKTKDMGSIAKMAIEEYPDTKYMDALLTKELTELSLQEREQVYGDLHCIPEDLPKESLDKLWAQISQVKRVLNEMDPSIKEAYIEAQRQDPKMLTNLKFILKFLRAAQYDPDQCAHRLAVYFETKKQIFGSEKLMKRLTLEDLDESGREVLEKGVCQLLPLQDRAGRGIIFWSMMQENASRNLSKHGRRQAQFYIYEVVSENESVQKHGAVVISNNYGPNRMSFERFKENLKNPSVVGMHQVRCAAFHFCVDDCEESRRVTSGIQKLVGRDTRVRFRTHIGTNAQIRASLSSFGIPAEVYPIDNDDGTTLTRNCMTWIADRERLEAAIQLGTSSSSSSRISELGDWDVVFGKGRIIQEMKGNVRYRRLIKNFFDHYESLGSPEEKTVCAIEIVQKIQAMGGRFLRKSKDPKEEWTEVDILTARDKVIATIQSLRRNGRKKLEQAWMTGYG